MNIDRCSCNDLIDRVRLVRYFGVTNVAADILQIADETVAFGTTKAAR
jgi:hypothetical protein